MKNPIFTTPKNGPFQTVGKRSFSNTPGISNTPYIGMGRAVVLGVGSVPWCSPRKPGPGSRRAGRCPWCWCWTWKPWPVPWSVVPRGPWRGPRPGAVPGSPVPDQDGQGRCPWCWTWKPWPVPWSAVSRGAGRWPWASVRHSPGKPVPLLAVSRGVARAVALVQPQEARPGSRRAGPVPWSMVALSGQLWRLAVAAPWCSHRKTGQDQAIHKPTLSTQIKLSKPLKLNKKRGLFARIPESPRKNLRRYAHRPQPTPPNRQKA